MLPYGNRSTAQYCMAYHDPSNPSANTAETSRHTCPTCGEPLLRIPRRAVDRLLSLFSPVHRYRCRNHSCRWQGNISVQNTSEEKVDG